MLSNSETVDAVTSDLRWKAACGLAVTAGAFHPTTLTYWRRRLADSEANRIFEAVRAVVGCTGVPAPVAAAFLPIARRWRALTAIPARRGRRGESPHLSAPGGNVG